MSQRRKQHEEEAGRAMEEVASLVRSSTLKILSKRRFIFNTLHDVISQKTEPFMIEICLIWSDSSINDGDFTRRLLYAMMDASECQGLFCSLHIVSKSRSVNIFETLILAVWMCTALYYTLNIDLHAPYTLPIWLRHTAVINTHRFVQSDSATLEMKVVEY
jgi:hypothetical protein